MVKNGRKGIPGWRGLAWCIALLSGCAIGPTGPSGGIHVTGSPHTGLGEPTFAPQVVATAHPLATGAGLEMLALGGSAVDAAIAAQLMLGLVEPQSSGLGGGLLMLHWDAASRKLTTIDGLAAAPSRVTASLRTDVDGQLLPSEPSQRGGRSVGVPGVLPALILAHQRHGRLTWHQLVSPALKAAEQGFGMPAYLHSVLASPEAAKALRPGFGQYFDQAGRPWPVGTVLRHPAYAHTMRQIATVGPQAWLDGRGTAGMLRAAQQGFKPSLMSAEDIKNYRAVEREPVCAAFLAYRVCTAAPPSFGGIAVLQILQMVQARAAGRFDFEDPAFLHLFAEAGKLAQADRRLYVGDPDHVSVPTQALVSNEYAAQRARLIDPSQAHPHPAAGKPRTSVSLQHLVPDDSPAFAQTSQLAVADRQGNVVSLTTTNNLNFGARLSFDGVVLNNAMTNFSAAPRPGEQLANQMAAHKRPITSMAPTMAFDANGRPILAGGSAGGGPIVDYVAAGVIDMLANGRTPAQALARPHLTTATPGRVQMEAGRGLEIQAAGLATRGHVVEQVPLNSGQTFIRLTPAGWLGATDPRRDGQARSQ